MKSKFLLIALLMPFVALQAQTSDSTKVITNSQMIGIGGTNVLDTYLSAEHFTGIGISYLSHTERQKTGKLWQINERLGVQVGGMVNASLGFIYNTSNSNNPAQARAHVNVMPTAVATYRFQLFNKPILARYEVGMNLVGVQFSPNYGQSYYEIFSRGNYDHNIVPTTIVCAPEWRHMITFDAAVSKKMTLRIGYLGNMQQSKVNGLRQHIYTHRVLIGFTRRFSIISHAL